jgi:hypothetical protein
MAWDGIPWFVENTSASEETLRLIVETAAAGGEGVIAPADLVVSALDLPGTAVQVGPGAMVAKRRAAGGGAQSYAARMPTAEQVPVEPTTADGPRSDLVVARVEDPYGGEVWPEPEDPTVGPYVFTRVISDVPTGTTSVQDIEPGTTAVTLARIDVPAATAAITADMITDLRQIVRPRSRASRRYMAGAWATTPDDLGPVTDVWETFPLGATWPEQVPEWATHTAVHVSVTGLLHPDAVEARGQVRVALGAQVGAGMPYIAEHAGRLALQVGAKFAHAPADRGEVLTVSVEGIGDAAFTGLLRADGGTAVSVEVTHTQEPVVA